MVAYYCVALRVNISEDVVGYFICVVGFEEIGPVRFLTVYVFSCTCRWILLSSGGPQRIGGL